MSDEERVRKLCHDAMIAASQTSHYGTTDGVLHALEMMAHYAVRLEDALGGTCGRPWEDAELAADDSPDRWIDDRDREYERRCKRDGVEL